MSLGVEDPIIQINHIIILEDEIEVLDCLG